MCAAAGRSALDVAAASGRVQRWRHAAPRRARRWKRPARASATPGCGGGSRRARAPVARHAKGAGPAMRAAPCSVPGRPPARAAGRARDSVPRTARLPGRRTKTRRGRKPAVRATHPYPSQSGAATRRHRGRRGHGRIAETRHVGREHAIAPAQQRFEVANPVNPAAGATVQQHHRRASPHMCQTISPSPQGVRSHCAADAMAATSSRVRKYPSMRLVPRAVLRHVPAGLKSRKGTVNSTPTNTSAPIPRSSSSRR